MEASENSTKSVATKQVTTTNKQVTATERVTAIDAAKALQLAQLASQSFKVSFNEKLNNKLVFERHVRPYGWLFEEPPSCVSVDSSVRSSSTDSAEEDANETPLVIDNDGQPDCDSIADTEYDYADR